MLLSFTSLIQGLKNRIRLLKNRKRRSGRRDLVLTERLEARVVLTNVTAYHQANPGTTDPSTINAGVNSNETILTPANVNSTTFGKLFATTVDGQVYAEPLYVESINITTGNNKGVHNVAIVATQNDSVYAIDSTTGVILWQDALLKAEHSGTVTAVPSSAVNSGDISPEIGITATPVIDAATGTIFVEAKSQEVAVDGTHFEHHLYALNLQDGSISNSVLIADSIGDNYVSGPSVQGNGDGSNNGVLDFDALRQMDRPGLTLVNGSIYLAFASHGDNGPYHGWILGYTESTFALNATFNANPNGNDDGIWQGGGSLTYETVGGNVFFYFETGNGSFDTTLVQSPFNPNLMIPNGGDYGDSFVKVEVDGSAPANGSLNATNNINGWGLHVADYFTPTNEGNLSNGDTDLGSGGPLILPASAGSAAHPNLLVGAGKEGRIYLMDRNNMGGYGGDAAGDGASGTDNVVQETGTGAVNGVLDTPTFFNGQLYYVGGYGDVAKTFSISDGVISSTAITQSTDGYAYTGSTAMISADPSGANAVVWDISSAGTNELRAYSASSGYQTEIYTSSQAANGRDSMGTAIKFTVPTIADGKVFVGTSNSLVAYGLLHPAIAAPKAPTNLTASTFSGSVINLSWTDHDTSPNTATTYNIYQSTDGINFALDATASAGANSYAVGGLQLSTQYYYKVDATNSLGTSAFTNIANAKTSNVASPLNFSTGFAGSTNQLTFNGSATLNGPSVQLTDGKPNEAGSVFSTDVVDVASFTSEFTFKLINPVADGITFAIQGNAPTALGPSGGGLGYGAQQPNGTLGIPNSVAVKFDINNNAGEGSDSTGLYTGGASPTTPSIDLSSSGIQFNNGDIFDVLMTYDGTNLNVTITDTKTNATANQTYAVNIPQVVGGTAAHVGFTGGTSATSATQDILTWDYNPNASTIPAAPTGLTGTVISGSEIDVSWTDNSNNESYFLIDRSTDGTNFTQIATVGANVTDYHDTSLTPNETVYYKVEATDAAGSSAFTNVFQAKTALPPTPPSNLVATNITATEVDLTWVNQATNATGIKILEQLGKNTAKLVASGLAPTTTSYAIKGLTPGTTYLFEIDALNSSGPSGAGTITVDTMPVPVTGVTATGGAGAIFVNWSADPGAKTYNIYRSTSPTESSVPTWTGIAGKSYEDSNITPGTTYYYAVTAVDPNAASPGAPPASAAGETVLSSQVSALALVSGVNDPTGFASAAGLTLNGGATVTSNNLQLTDGGTGEARTVFDNIPQYIGNFSTQFTFQISGGTNPTGEGFTFTIQGNGPAALGPSGAGLGYGGTGGIPNSVAIKFDLTDNQGEGADSTGLYVDGLIPTVIGSIDMTGSVDLHRGDVMQATLTYDGSKLTESILDTVTNSSFTQKYTGVNIPSIMGSSVGYVGFTASSGVATAVQNIQSWTFTPTISTTFNPPTNLVGIAENGPQVQLTWNDNSTSATSFTLERATDAAFTQNLTNVTVAAPTTATVTYLDTTVVPGNTYYYRVQAVKGPSVTVFSNAYSAVIPTSPAAPSNGHATQIGTTTAAIAWTDNAPSAGNYNVFREVVGGTFSQIATLPATATSYTDTGLTLGTNYDYQIQAANITGTSAKIDVNFWTVSPAITTLANSATGGPIQLSWTAPVGSSLLTYNVYRGTSAGHESAIPIAKGLTALAYTDANVIAGATYYYTVTSVDANSLSSPNVGPFGESAASNEVTGRATTGVLPGPAAKLLFVQQPTAITAGTVISPAFTVKVNDAFGNLVTSDTSTVTVKINSGTFASGATTVTAKVTNGVATFSGIVVNLAGSYTLTATDSALTSATSTRFAVNAAAASKLVIVQAPTAGTIGVSLSPSVKVAVEDAFGNVVSNGSTITLTLSSGTFSTGITTVAVAATNGVATFGNLIINTVGTDTLKATDGTLVQATSGIIKINGVKPTISTATSAIVTSSTVVLGGNITNSGGLTVTASGVVFSLTSVNANPQIGGTGVGNMIATSTSGVFTVNATGLIPGMQYSFAAYATNSIGTTYTSPVSTFTTLAAPALSGLTAAQVFLKGSAAMPIALNLVVADTAGVKLAGATVTISNWQGEDRLTFSNTYALQHTFIIAGTNAVLTFTGSATAAAYQTTLQTLEFQDLRQNGPVLTARVFSIVVSDGSTNSNAVTTSITVKEVNLPPVVLGLETTPLAYKVNSAPVAISASILVTDPVRNNLSSLTVQISSGYQDNTGGKDLLSFVNQNGITGSFNAVTGTLTLSGISSLSNYRTALRSILFSTSGTSVSTASRTLTILATDDSPTPVTSVAVTREINITP